MAQLLLFKLAQAGEYMLIKVDGVEGAFETFGTGRPIVLIPSPLVLARTYRSTVEQLAKVFQVTTVELPGSGQAQCLREGMSGSQYAEWLAAFFAEVGLDRPIVVGHSRSGSIAVALAANYPEKVEKLVIVDATGTGPHSYMQIFGKGSIDLFLDFRLVLTAWRDIVGNFIRHRRNFLRQMHDSIKGNCRTDAQKVIAPTFLQRHKPWSSAGALHTRNNSQREAYGPGAPRRLIRFKGFRRIGRDLRVMIAA
jgi:pimeloyl-ACP methyl ester carboxylesterase